MDPSSSSNEGEQSQQDYWNAAQAVMAQGEKAAQLLNNPIFNTAYRAQMEDTINQWMTSQDKEVNRRESLYHQVQALVAMATKMQSFVEQAEMLRAEQDTQRSAQKKRADHLDSQGFRTQ